MLEEKNKQVFRQLIEEGFNNGSLGALDELCTPDFIEHQEGIMPPTVKGLKGAILSLRTPFPDLVLTIEEIIASGDKTWARITGRGTHQGIFMGQAPTGKPFAITVIDICHFENNKIAEHWGVADRLSLMAQLGLLPKPSKNQ